MDGRCPTFGTERQYSCLSGQNKIEDEPLLPIYYPDNILDPTIHRSYQIPPANLTNHTNIQIDLSIYCNVTVDLIDLYKGITQKIQSKQICI